MTVAEIARSSWGKPCFTPIWQSRPFGSVYPTLASRAAGYRHIRRTAVGGNHSPTYPIPVQRYHCVRLVGVHVVSMASGNGYGPMPMALRQRRVAKGA